MPLFSLKVNSTAREVNVDSGTSLLWVLREHLGLMGTKYGCGVGQCGACTIHINGSPMRACAINVEAVAEGQSITTIEGLSKKGDHPLQKAWVAHQVPQCGYCQSGQIMQAAALLENNPSPSRDEILQSMNGNLCRCGTYMRIFKAIESVSKES